MIPSCALTKPDPDRQIGLCTLVFGTANSGGTARPTSQPPATSHPTSSAASSTTDRLSTVSTSSRSSQSPVEIPVSESMAIPAAVCSGDSTAIPAAVCPGDSTAIPAAVCSSESTAIPAAVCPGYPSVAEESVAVDIPPADLPADKAEFRIVVTHVDDDGHIYGQELKEGTFFPLCFAPPPQTRTCHATLTASCPFSPPDVLRDWFSGIMQFAITINSSVCLHIRVPNTLMRESYA